VAGCGRVGAGGYFAPKTIKNRKIVYSLI